MLFFFFVFFFFKQKTAYEIMPSLVGSEMCIRDRDYIAALTQGQEDERKRLARELHDETVQSLIALSQRVTMLDLDLAEGFQHPQPASILPQLQGRIGELSTMLTQTLGGVRDLIRDLRPIYLEELGLVSALEMLAQATQRDDLETSFEVNGEERRL